MLHHASDFCDAQSEALALDDVAFHSERRQPERLTFELPASIWAAMIGCYVVLLSGLLVATGFGARATMMIVISAIYIAIFFGVSSIVNAISGNVGEAGFREGHDGTLQTLTGPLPASSVAVQVLIVPLAFAFLGAAFAVIRLIVV